MTVKSEENLPVNFAQLRDSAVGDSDLMRELVEIYFTETKTALDTLEKAVKEKNFSEIYGSAHKAVGGSLTCGMQAIVPFLRQLEKIGRTENITGAEETLLKAKEAFNEMKDFTARNQALI